MALSGNGLSGVKDLAAKLTPLQKVLIGAALITVVVGGVLLRGGSTPTTMAPLFTDLAPADASSVIDALNAQNVSHTLADGGRTVLVPESKVYELRVSLSAKGLPATNDGYALLDKQGITASEFTQRVDYQRALEGELDRTLKAMQGVKNAIVRLALPDSTLFVDQPQTTTASVMLDTGMTSLGSDAVQAVVHLVAASVKGLDPKNVTVVDAAGAVLAGPDADSAVGTATTRAKAEKTYESALAASLTAMVAKVTGQQNVSVSVSASLDLAEKSTQTETFGTTDPVTGNKKPGVVASESSSSENYTGTGAAAQTGVLGADGATVSPTGSANNNYTKTQADRQYNIDRVVEQTKSAPGQVTGLHIAVLLDDKAVTAQQAKDIETTVNAAAGINGQRGDTLVVTRLPFAATATTDTTAADAKTAAAAVAHAKLLSNIRTYALLGVALLALLLGFASARRARRVVLTPIQLEPADEFLALEAGDGPEYLDLEEVHMPTELAPVMHHAELPVAQEPFVPIVRERNDVVELAEQHPVEVANVIRNWLNEDREAALQ